MLESSEFDEGVDISPPYKIDDNDELQANSNTDQTERKRRQESLKQTIMEFKEANNPKRQRQNNVQMTQGGQRTSDAKKIGNYVIGKVLGQGTFGKVRQATHVLTGEKVAVKILEKEKIKDEQEAMRIMREINILKIVRHPNIVQLYEIIETSRQLYLIMEFSPNGELFDYIVKKRKLPESEASRFYRQIVAGVEYLHMNKISHRDLKPENLLLDENMNIKIVDFGLSIMYKNAKDQVLKTACGSPCYAPPEMILGKRYSGLSTDIWTLGVILYAMTVGYLPFEDKDTNKLYKKILSCDYLIPGFLSANVKDLMKLIIQVKPEKRCTIKDIKNHAWCQHSPTPLEGIIVAQDKIPTLEVIYQEVRNLAGIEKFGNLETLKTEIENNRHNQITSTYYLVIKKYERGTDQDLVFGKFTRDKRLEREQLAKSLLREDAVSQEQTHLSCGSMDNLKILGIEQRQQSEKNRYAVSDKKSTTVYNGPEHRRRKLVSRGEQDEQKRSNHVVFKVNNRKRMNSTSGGDVFEHGKMAAEQLLRQNGQQEDPYNASSGNRALMSVIRDKHKKAKNEEIATISSGKLITLGSTKPIAGVVGGPDIIRALRNKRSNTQEQPTEHTHTVTTQYFTGRSPSPNMSQTVYGTMPGGKNNTEKNTRNQFSLQQQAILMRSQQAVHETSQPYDDLAEQRDTEEGKHERSSSMKAPKTYFVENMNTLNENIYLSQARVKNKMHHRNLTQALSHVHQKRGIAVQGQMTTQQPNIQHDEIMQRDMHLTQQSFQQVKPGVIQNNVSPKFKSKNPKNRQIKIPVNKMVGQNPLLYNGEFEGRKVSVASEHSTESLSGLNMQIMENHNKQKGISVSQVASRKIINMANDDLANYGLKKSRAPTTENLSRNGKLDNGAVIVIQQQPKARGLNTAGNSSSPASFHMPLPQENASFQTQQPKISKMNKQSGITQVKNNFLITGQNNKKNEVVKLGNEHFESQNPSKRINFHAMNNTQGPGFMQMRKNKQSRSQPPVQVIQMRNDRQEYNTSVQQDNFVPRRINENSWIKQKEQQVNPYQIHSQNQSNGNQYFIKTSLQGEKYHKQNMSNKLIIKQ